MLGTIRGSLNTFILDALKAYVLLFIFQYTTQILMNISVEFDLATLKRNSAIISLTLTSLTQLLLSVMLFVSVVSLILYFIK